MASDERLFTPGDAELLVQQTASTLNTIATYQASHGRFDRITTQMVEKQMYNLIGSCTRLITDHELRPIRHQLKNALYDIVQACQQSNEEKNKLLLDYLGTLCTGDEDKRDTSAYGDAALMFARMVANIFLEITTRTRVEVKAMDKNDWTTHKNLFIMRLTLIEEWQDIMVELSSSSLAAARINYSNKDTKSVEDFRRLLRLVDSDDLIPVKSEEA